MVFPGDAPQAVAVMTAPPASIAPSPQQPHRAAALRVKPRSRLPQPPFKAWDNPDVLRRAGGGGGGVPASSTTPSASSLSALCSERRSAGPRDDGFERIRAKLMDHLREAAGRIDLPAVAPGQAKGKEPAAEAPVEDADDGEAPPDPIAAAASTAAPPNHALAPAAAAGEDLPWKLRTRRSTAVAASQVRDHRPEPHTGSSAQRPAPSPPAKVASRARCAQSERRDAAPRRRRPRFSVPLTKEEIDEDLYAFTGRRAPRRPKKRPRPIQKQLDMVFPGLWLSEVTVDTYQVADPLPPPPS